MAGLKIITPPVGYPVTLADVKPQLRIDPDDDSYDDTLEPLIAVATDWCESYQNRAYLTQTLELALDHWPCPPHDFIRLPRPPLQSVVSVTYTDRNGVTTTWDPSTYIVNDYWEPAQIVRAAGVCWPSVCLAPTNGVKVRYVAGYGAAEDVPQRIKQAIILYVSEMFDAPGCPPSDAVKSLLDLDRVVPI